MTGTACDIKCISDRRRTERSRESLPPCVSCLMHKSPISTRPSAPEKIKCNRFCHFKNRMCRAYHRLVALIAAVFKFREEADGRACEGTGSPGKQSGQRIKTLGCSPEETYPIPFAACKRLALVPGIFKTVILTNSKLNLFLSPPRRTATINYTSSRHLPPLTRLGSGK